MATLLLRLAGPMQSWGTMSRFDERDSGLEPSKSGVIGMICAALGRDRTMPVDDLAALRMAVRVDREGVLMRDYQTATGVFLAGGKASPGRTVVSPRYYLADAAFLVGLEGGRGLLDTIQQALQQPFWPIALGRKSMPPGQPVWFVDGVQDESLDTLIRRWPIIAENHTEHRGHLLRLMSEHPSEGSIRFDQPIGPFSERSFGPRYIKPETIDVPDKIST